MTATRVADPAGLLGESLAEASAGRNPGRRGSARVSTAWPPPAGPGPEGRVRHPGRAPVPPPAEPGPAGSSLAAVLRRARRARPPGPAGSGLVGSRAAQGVVRSAPMLSA